MAIEILLTGGVYQCVTRINSNNDDNDDDDDDNNNNRNNEELDK